MWSRPRTYTYRAFQPASVRHRRRLLAAAGLLVVAVSLPVLTGPWRNSAPRPRDAAALEVTHLGSRVVVYSLPTHTSHHGHSGDNNNGDNGASDDSGGRGGETGEAGGSTGSAHIDKGAHGDSARGSTILEPDIVDGPSGQATVTNSTPQGSTTFLNGVGPPNDPGSSRPRSSTPPVPSAGATPQPPPLPVMSGTSVWPPLQTQNGTPASVAPSAPTTSRGAIPPAVSSTTPPLPAPSIQGPTSFPASGPGSAGSATVAPSMLMLMPVQCPPNAPARAVCFEIVNGGGAMAALPASPSTLGTLPISPPPPACPGSNNQPDMGTSQDLAPGEPGSPTSGGTTRADGSTDSHGSTGEENTHDTRDDKPRKKSTKKNHATNDATDDTADTDAGTPTGNGASTLTTCGLLGSASSEGGVGGGVTGVAGGLSGLVAHSGEHIELTGYSFQDNQGGNNATISCPQIHQHAGGTGTYQDPITVASGGKSGSASADGIRCGDRFYLPSIRRYVIVEDTGNTPNKSQPHLDLYVADDPDKKCMNAISGTVTAIPHPPPGLPVMAGPIGNHGSCLLPGTGAPGGQP